MYFDSFVIAWRRLGRSADGTGRRCLDCHCKLSERGGSARTAGLGQGARDGHVPDGNHGE